MTLVAVYLLNIVVGAVLYLDVRWTRRSGWWLLAFWAAPLVAMVAYLVSRRRPVVPS